VSRPAAQCYDGLLQRKPTVSKAPQIFQDFALLKQKATKSVFECFDELAEGCLVVDQDVRVVMISERYAANLGVDPADVLGKEIETFLPHSLMRQVVVTGKPILLEIFETGGHALVVTRMPLKGEDGAVVGAMAFALYSDLEPLKPLVERFSQLQAELAHAQRRLAEARRHIERHLADPDPSPASVAAALGIAVRTLHASFEPTGTSFARHVLHRRLEECRAALLGSPGRAVTDIAFAWGFSSLSGFYRGFQAAFGMSPGDLRAASRTRQCS